jgi:hypothetical protein
MPCLIAVKRVDHLLHAIPVSFSHACCLGRSVFPFAIADYCLCPSPVHPLSFIDQKLRALNLSAVLMGEVDAAEAGCSMQTLELPAGGKLSVDFIKQLQQSMLDASWKGVGALSQVVPVKLVNQILTKVSAILDAEPTLLEVG